MKFRTTFYDNEMSQMRIETSIDFSSQNANVLPHECLVKIMISIPSLCESGDYVQLRGERLFSDFLTIPNQHMSFWLKDRRHVENIRNNVDLRKRLADKIHEELQNCFKQAMGEHKKCKFKPIDSYKAVVNVEAGD